MTDGPQITGTAIAIGIAVGVTIGLVIDSIVTGIGIGLAMILTFAISRARAEPQEKDRRDRGQTATAEPARWRPMLASPTASSPPMPAVSTPICRRSSPGERPQPYRTRRSTQRPRDHRAALALALSA